MTTIFRNIYLDNQRLHVPTTLIDVRMFGAVGDGVADDSAAINGAIAAAIASSGELYLTSVYLCLSDVPQVHQVRLKGPGGLQLPSARVWRAEPSVRSAFSARQTLYVNPTGSDSNSGLGPTFALKTVLGAEAVLSRYGYLAGNWSLTLAAGEYTEKVTFYGIANEASAPLYIEGPAPASAWNNTTPPANGDATGGSVPTVIVRPPVPSRGVPGYGIGWDISHSVNVSMSNVQFRDWGNNTYTGNDGAIRLSGRATLWTSNVHVWDSNGAITARDFSSLNVDGGIVHGCRNAFFLVAGVRYQTGYGQTAAGQTSAALIRQNVFGLDAWEDATGHADYAIFEDNGIHIHARRKAHVSMIGTTLRNTGGFGASVGIQVRENSVAVMDPTIVWSGTHTPRLATISGGQVTHLDQTINPYSTELMAWATPNQTTSGTTALTLATLPIAANEFTFNPQAILVRAVVSLNNLLGNATLTVRANGVFLSSLTVPLVAGLRVADLEIGITPTDATNQIVVTSEISANNTGGATRLTKVTAAATGNFAIAQSVTVQIACANAADAVTVQRCEVFRRG